jgi:formate hydrogenlyase transcriptional activator
MKPTPSVVRLSCALGVSACVLGVGRAVDDVHAAEPGTARAGSATSAAPTAAATSSTATGALPPAVLLLFAQRTTAPAVIEMEEGFRRQIEQSYDGRIDLHVEYLDIPDTADVKYLGRLVDLLREKYEERPIRVVVAVRSEALRFALQFRRQLFPGAPLVFTDTTRAALEGLALPPDVTGVFLQVGNLGTVSIALDLHPEARRVVIVCGTSSADQSNETLVRRLAEAHSPGIEVVSMRGLVLEEQLRRLSQLPRDSVVIFTGYRTDAQGRSAVPRDVLRLVVRASAVPVYGASETYLGEGIVGGDLIRFRPLAEGAARLAARILRGEDASSIPPIDQLSSQPMFDWRELRRWGIPESRLPKGSVVLFREPNLWSEHWRAILLTFALLVGQTLLIVSLLLSRRRRRAAEAGLRDAEQRYRTVADFTHDWEYWGRPDESFAYVSPSCLRTTGYTAEDFYARPTLLTDIIAPEDRARWTEHSALARSAAHAAPALEIRIVRADGEVRWIDHVCVPVTDQDGRFLGRRGSNRDITDRKRSEEALRQALAEIGRLRERLEADNTYLREQVEPEPGFEGIVGRSDALRYVLAKVQQVAPATTTVLLQGETGVGKELFAHALHSLSPRRERPLVKLNCAALPPTLVESELFGHEKGAFTGAVAQRKGRFEIADGSTLLLDEVGELPLELQSKLLRVIQDGQFERVGGTTTLKVDVRLIAATNRHLDEDVKAGRFRQDLWYRLNVFPITIPPLRKRPEDIPLLARHFVEKHCRRLGRPVLEISVATLEHLQSREWPGNVRELDSVIERTVITSPGDALRLADLGEALRAERRDESGRRGVATVATVKTLDENEREHILATLERTAWRVQGEGGAAELLGINPSTLRSRMLKLGIPRRAERPAESARPAGA